MQLAAKETLRCADIVEEMFVNLHECIDKKGKNIENERKRCIIARFAAPNFS